MNVDKLVCKSGNLTERIRFQQREVAQLKKEIFGTARRPRSAYIRRFMEEYADFEAISSYSEMLGEARRARIIYIGDYHALEKGQYFSARLLEDLADRPIMLALEMLYGRNQRALDDWMEGKIDDEMFRRRVRFDLEWGYYWGSFREILDVARRLKMPSYAIDFAPRNDLRYIRKRDTAVAARIADILEQNPDRALVVVFGESHLASEHLPAKVLRHFGEGRAPRTITVLQNLDSIYWKAACLGFEGGVVVKVRPGVYCALNATPFEKYEAYRRRLEIWSAHDQDDQRLDLTSTVYNLINAISDFIGIDKVELCLRHEGSCVERFVDAYPEVYSFAEFGDFEALLQRTSLSRIQTQEILNHAMRQGSCYVPKVNAIFIGKFNLIHGAEEAAHFVNFALKRQRFEHYRPKPLEQADEFYLKVLEEALGYFGSKLIEPSRDHLAESPILNWKHVPRTTKQLLGVSSLQVRWMRRFLLSHKKLERKYRRMRKLPKIIGQGIGSRGRVFTLLTHELGYLLGEQIYRGYLAGSFSRKEISGLFHKRFENAGAPANEYFRLAGRGLPLSLDNAANEMERVS